MMADDPTAVERHENSMKAVYIPYNNAPRIIELDNADDCTRFLEMPTDIGYDMPFGRSIALICDENVGQFPNRAIFATKDMEERHVKSRMATYHMVLEGELHAILCGRIIALGRDLTNPLKPWRGLTDEEAALVIDYFTRVSPPESGAEMFLKTMKGHEQ